MTSSVPATVADVSSTRSEYTDHGTSSPSRHYLRRWGDSYNASTSSTTSTTSQHHLALNHQHHRLSSTNNSQWWLKHPPKLENTTRGGNNFSPGELLPATTLRSALMSGSASGSVVTFMDGASLGSGSGAGSFRRSGSVGSGWGSSASRQSCGSASAFGSGIPQPPQLLHFGNNTNNNNSNVPRTSTRTVAGSMDASETNDSGRKRAGVGAGVVAQPVNVPGLLRECPSESDPQLRLPLPPTTAKSGGHPSFLRRWSEKIESANQQQQQQQQPTTTTTTSGAPVLPPRATPTSSTSNIHTHTFDLDFASLTQVEDDLVHAAQMELQQEVNDTSLNAVPISEKLQQVQCAMTNWGFAEKVSNTTSARGGGGDASCSLPAIMREESTSLRAVHEDQACRRFLGLVHRASPTGTHTARHYDRQLLLPSVSASLHSSRMPGKRSSAGSFSDRFGGATQDVDGNSAHNTSPPRRMVLSRSSPVLAVADREDELSVLSLFSGPSHAR